MEKKILFGTAMIILNLCFPIFIFAETIILKSGNKIEEEIIEKTDKYIRVEYNGSFLTYSLDDIESIDGKKIGHTSTSATSFERDYTKGWDEWYASVRIFMDKVAGIEDKTTQILNKNDKNLENAMRNNDYARGERIFKEIIGGFIPIIEEFKALNTPPEFSKYIAKNIESYNYRKLYYEATLKHDRDLAFQSYSKALKAKLEAIEESKRIFMQHRAPKEILNFADGEINYYKTLLDEFLKEGFR